MHERRFNPQNVHRLEDPARREWMPIEPVLEMLALGSGMNVADIGAGTGYFAIPIAQALAPTGTVFAIDVQPEMLRHLEAKLTQPGAPKNIELREGDASQTGLPGQAVDLVFIANVWHELDDYSSALQEVRRILKRSGRLAIFDWRADMEYPPGPPQHHRVGASDVHKFLLKQGWDAAPPAFIGQYSYLVIANARG